MDPLNDIGAAQRERVKFIDHRAYLLGKVGRKDLQHRFGIASAAATRDFSLYNNYAPQNLAYQPKIRSYVVNPNFTPLFEYQAKDILLSLTSNLAGESITDEEQLRLGRTPEIELLSTLTRAIHLQKVIECTYLSTRNGKSIKKFVPHALFDTGLHWYVRGYDKSKARFADFSLSRFLEVKNLSEAPLEKELQAEDNAYQTIVPLVITAHPQQKHPETIEYDYGMENRQLVKEVRAPFVGYFLRRWNIDSSLCGDVNDKAYQLRLDNIHEVSNLADLYLAPGFQYPE